MYIFFIKYLIKYFQVMGWRNKETYEYWEAFNECFQTGCLFTTSSIGQPNR